MKDFMHKLLVLSLVVFGTNALSSSVLQPKKNIPILFQDFSSSSVDTDRSTKENVIEVDEDLFTDMGAVVDLQTLLSNLGISQEGDQGLSFRFSQASEDQFDSRISESTSGLSLRINDETRSTKSSNYLMNPEQAHCDPELKTVSLQLDDDSESIQYYPTCIKINQCGGCCPKKDILECQPIATKKIKVQVIELRKQNNVRRRRQRRRVTASYKSLNVTVEEHTQCACMCKNTEDSCDLRIQRFNLGTCLCECTNTDNRDKCSRSSSKLWDRDTCSCVCRDPKICSPGEKFDSNSCLCVRRRIPTMNRGGRRRMRNTN